MYIDNIDTILDRTLNDFFETVVLKKTLNTIFATPNFVEKQEEIMKLLHKYFTTLDLSEISKIITDNQHIKIITHTIHKYVFYYVFTIIGYFYEKNIDVFKNNVIEFSKSGDKQKYDLTNFFTSESNSNIFMLTDVIRGVRDVLSVDKSKHKASDKSNIIGTSFLDEIGEILTTKINEMFTNEKNPQIRAHSLIKLVLSQKLYLKNDKPMIINILENETIMTGESIYIDVVVPIERYVDIIDIESMLSPDDIAHGVARNIYDTINKGEILYKQQTLHTTETKIMELINSGFVIPITEDFLLYHKDSVKYETTNSDKNKRDTLKVKYILDKINAVENYYTNETKPNSLLYTPLSHRFAVAVNDTEDMNILNKASAYGGNDTTNYTELMHYKQYPYINFKDFKKNGFPIIFDKTNTVIRSVSFGEKGRLQLRIGSEGQQVNIIGFVLNGTKNTLECIQSKQVPITNKGYDDFMDNITQNIMNGSKNIIGWIFDLDNDDVKLDTYERFDKNDKIERCKLICAKLRDDIVDAVFNKITNVLTSHNELSFYDAFKIVDKITKNTLALTTTDNRYNEIERIIFHKIYEKYIPRYDINEDIVYGLYGDTLKLPNIPPPPKDDTIRIHLVDEKKSILDQYEYLAEGVVCQHFVTWSNIMAHKRDNTTKTIDDIYDFAQKFVIETNEIEYICKSCGALLDIKKYVSEGSYDETTQRFVPSSIPMNVQLEELPEYKRYNISIRNIDGLINKIAENINIPYLSGSTLTQKINRTTMVKDAIDLILLNNSILEKNFKERNENAVKLYGINRELSNLFAFDLDNSIFLYTPGKEKDFYKLIKHNNIIAYIICLILLELDDSHIAFLSMDKVCNYNLYAKFGNIIFDKLRIRINSSGDTKNIAEYPVLCYMLYVITCILSKYPLWHHDDDDKKDTKKKVNPVKQKIMVHTIIDLLNCILENAVKNRTKHIYETVFTKFNKKLNTTYSKDDTINRLRNENTKTVSHNTKNGTERVIPIAIQKSYEPMTTEVTDYMKYKSAKYYPPKRKIEQPITKATNREYCVNGLFHVWKQFGKSFKCDKCGVELEKNIYSRELTDKVQENIKIRYLERICDKYCISGELHSYNDNMQCELCGYKMGNYLQLNKMKEIDVIVTNPTVISKSNIIDTKRIKHDEFVSKVIGTLQKQYAESKTHRDDYYKFIENFIDTLQKNVGNIINIDDKTINLREDTYIIDHNHLGYPIEPPITILERNPLLSFKLNHTFFKTDVIIYNTGGTAKIEVYYDMRTHVLLGYKEVNKEHISNIKTANKIRIDYSLFNKVKYLGNVNKYIDVSTYVDPINGTQLPMHDIVKSLSTARIENIGNIIYKFLVYTNMIKAKVKPKLHENLGDNKIDMDDEKMFDVEKYYRKLIGMITVYDNTKILKLWNIVVQNIHYRSVSIKNINIDIHNKLINIDDVHNYDYSGNLLLYYFVSELLKLLDINKNKYVRQSLTQYIIEFIEHMFTEYNNDYYDNMNDIQRFLCIINSSEYFRELENKGLGMDEYTTGIYGEYKDPSDEKTKEELDEEFDDREAAESMDVDGEIDAEDEYDNAYTDRQPSRPDVKWIYTISDPFTD